MDLDLVVGARFAAPDGAQVDATDIRVEYRKPVQNDGTEVTRRVPVAQRPRDGPRGDRVPSHRVSAPEPMTVDVDPGPYPDELAPPYQCIKAGAVEVAQHIGGRHKTAHRQRDGHELVHSASLADERASDAGRPKPVEKS